MVESSVSLDKILVSTTPGFPGIFWMLAKIKIIRADAIVVWKDYFSNI